MLLLIGSNRVNRVRLVDAIDPICYNAAKETDGDRFEAMRCYKKRCDRNAWSEHIYRLQSHQENGKKQLAKAKWKSKKNKLHCYKVIKMIPIKKA